MLDQKPDVDHDIPYHNTAQCFVSETHYDHRTKIGHAILQPISSPDARGIREMFLALDPEVKEIRYSDGERAGVHIRAADGGFIHKNLDHSPIAIAAIYKRADFVITPPADEQ